MDSGIGVSVISRDDDIAIVYIKNPPVKMGIAYYTFNALAEAGVVEVITGKLTKPETDKIRAQFAGIESVIRVLD